MLAEDEGVWAFGVDLAVRLVQGELGQELLVPRCCGSACLRAPPASPPPAEIFLHPYTAPPSPPPTHKRHPAAGRLSDGWGHQRCADRSGWGERRLYRDLTMCGEVHRGCWERFHAMRLNAGARPWGVCEVCGETKPAADAREKVRAECRRCHRNFCHRCLLEVLLLDPDDLPGTSTLAAGAWCLTLAARCLLAMLHRARQCEDVVVTCQPGCAGRQV
jgi:hypothetical protein